MEPERIPIHRLTREIAGGLPRSVFYNFDRGEFVGHVVVPTDCRVDYRKDRVFIDIANGYCGRKSLAGPLDATEVVRAAIEGEHGLAWEPIAPPEPAPEPANRVRCHGVEFRFGQDGDSVGGPEFQELRAWTADAGAGPYLVIATERWAIEMDEIGEFVGRLGSVVGTLQAQNAGVSDV